MADIGELVIQIRATAEGLEAVLSGAAQSIQRFAEQMETGISKVSLAPLKKEIENVGDSTEDKGKKIKAAWDDLGKAAASTLGDILQTVNQGITAYQDYQSAMQGMLRQGDWSPMS